MPGTRQDLCAYYDEIRRFDHRIGEVLEVLKEQEVLESTCIIIMADNGRAFPHSKTRVNDQGVKTPFILHWPEGISDPGVSSDALISVIDIAPLICGLAGIDPAPSFQGLSFAPLLSDPSIPHREFVFAEHNWHDYEAHERMVRNDRFMYIRNSRPMLPQMGPADAVGSPSMKDLKELLAGEMLTQAQADVFITPRPREELYDLESDPHQRLNVASVPEYKMALDEMSKILDQWMEETGDDVPEFLTPGWYLYEAGYIRTRHHGIRGTMPGEERDATSINAPGPL
jgi:arylsulfatase A-like enzyme